MSLLNRFLAALAVLAGYHGQEWWSPDRRWWVQSSRTARHDIPYGVRRRMLDWSREMERKDPLFNRFLDLCEQYVIGPAGLRIRSASLDREYASAANAEWESWQPFCDIASRFSFGQRQSLIEREMEVAGEVFIYLLYGSTGRPRIQLIESELVETPPELAKEPTVVDGIRVEENGRPISYFVREDGSDTKPRYNEVPAEQIIHMMEPSRIGQGRGLPIVYPVLKDMIDFEELQGFEMVAAKDASEKSTIIKNGTGEVSAADLIRSRMNLGSTTNAGTTATKSKDDFYREAIGGRTVVLQRGDDALQFPSNRPSVAMQGFWDIVQARIAAGLGVPIEIAIMRSLQGTMARGAFDMANDFFRCRSANRAESFSRVWAFVVGSQIRLRRIQPVDWRRTAYTAPKAINVDVGRNSSALIEEYNQGFKSLDDVVGPYGKTGEEVMRERARDYKRAREIEAEEQVPPGTCLPMMGSNEPTFETTGTNA